MPYWDDVHSCIPSSWVTPLSLESIQYLAYQWPGDAKQPLNSILNVNLSAQKSIGGYIHDVHDNCNLPWRMILHEMNFTERWLLYASIATIILALQNKRLSSSTKKGFNYLRHCSVNQKWNKMHIHFPEQTIQHKRVRTFLHQFRIFVVLNEMIPSHKFWTYSYHIPGDAFLYFFSEGLVYKNTWRMKLGPITNSFYLDRGPVMRKTIAKQCTCALWCTIIREQCSGRLKQWPLPFLASEFQFNNRWHKRLKGAWIKWWTNDISSCKFRCSLLWWTNKICSY